jgi:hypothetical protein
MEGSGSAKLVATGLSEPSADELDRRRGEIMEKINALEPDQLQGLSGSTAADDVSGHEKMMWEKTIWEK